MYYIFSRKFGPNCKLSVGIMASGDIQKATFRSPRLLQTLPRRADMLNAVKIARQYVILRNISVMQSDIHVCKH